MVAQPLASPSALGFLDELCLSIGDKVLSPIDERSYVGDPSALGDASGWAATVDLKSGVLELLADGSRGN